MPRERTTGPIMEAPVHGGAIMPCVVMTETAVHTVELDGQHFAAMVQSVPGAPFAAISILDRDEVEAQIVFLRNAMEDAERMDQGLAPIHAQQGGLQ